jgi:two-component system response regulator PilR (NtrC family)/two-component system response regulator HydG
MAKGRILVVDDDAAILDICAETLSVLHDTEIILENRSPRASERLATDNFDLLITDIRMPEMDGIELLRIARQLDPSLHVLILTGFPTIATAVESMKLGATDYLTKPFLPDDLLATARRLLQTRRLREENHLLQRQIERTYSFDEIVGKSPAIQVVFETIRRVAASDVDVLIRGETGTGKELVARSIHNRSQRRHARFMPIDCGAIPENLVESEFFGHERGAFTGAHERRLGLLEVADGGTVFLDEIVGMPLALQAKLLRVLQERRFRRVGGKDEIAVNIRVVAAASRDLVGEIRAQRFREDLYYRLHVGHVTIPPLRERGEDILLLVNYFVERYRREMGKPAIELKPEVMEILMAYPWPGNVRELQNVLKRVLMMSYGPVLSLQDLPDDIVAHAGDSVATDRAGFFQLREQRIAAFEREYLGNLLQFYHGDVAQAAREAGLPRGTLYRLLKKHGLAAEDFRLYA